MLLRAVERNLNHAISDDARRVLEELAQDPTFGWSRYAGESVDVCVVPGDHLSMAQEPHVRCWRNGFRSTWPKPGPLWNWGPQVFKYGDHAIEHEEQNLELLTGEGLVEERNNAFYNRFQFPPPPPPLQLHFLTDPSFERRFLNQDLGDWTHRRVPERPRILVAGCGTFQAITVALQFPTASVVGIDLSAESLATCRKAAREIGLRTLSVQEQSLTEASYAEEFDYIVCTGVIHHLDDPEAGLRALARALKPQGVLDLIVYNRFHRIPTSAYQRAIRLLLAGVPTGDLDHGIAFTRTLLDEYPM